MSVCVHRSFYYGNLCYASIHKDWNNKHILMYKLWLCECHRMRWLFIEQSLIMRTNVMSHNKLNHKWKCVTFSWQLRNDHHDCIWLIYNWVFEYLLRPKVCHSLLQILWNLRRNWQQQKDHMDVWTHKEALIQKYEK